MKCITHGIDYTESTCPLCKKDTLDLFNEKMSEKGQEKEVETEIDYKEIEKIVFGEGEEVTLRNGKAYKVLPATLKDARYIMENIGYIDTEIIVANFIPLAIMGADVDKDSADKRLETLLKILNIAFKEYALSDNFIEENVDVVITKRVINILLGLSGLKA